MGSLAKKFGRKPLTEVQLAAAEELRLSLREEAGRVWGFSSDLEIKLARLRWLRLLMRTLDAEIKRGAQ